jgi:polar amino acid transport system substrate-binding protein
MKRRRRVKDLLRAGIIMLMGMRVLVLLLATPLVLYAPAAFEAHAAVPETALQRILRTGTVRIGYAAEAPYAISSPDGRVTGEGPEVARKVFERMGVRNVVAIESEFGMLIHNLKAKRFDVIATGMYILPDRCRQIAFSEPTYKAVNQLGQGMAVAAGNPRNIHAYDDVANDRSIRLGVVAGTIEHRFAREAGIGDEQIMLFPSAAQAARSLRAGRIDAYAATAKAVDALVERYPRRLERAKPFDSQRDAAVIGQVYYGASGFRFQDDDLLAAFNKHLLGFLGTPEHLALVANFGVTKYELPDRTTAEICRRRG